MKGFAQDIRRGVAQCIDLVVDVRIAGDEDHVQIDLIAIPDLAGELEAADRTGEPDVRDHEIEAGLLGQGPRLVGIGGAFDTRESGRERPFDEGPHPGFVFQNENRLARNLRLVLRFDHVATCNGD